MQASLREAEQQEQQNTSPDQGLAKLRSDLTHLRRESALTEQKALDLGHDARILEKLSSDALRALRDSAQEVAAVQAELSGLYQHVCKAGSHTPSKVMLMRGAAADEDKKKEEEKGVKEEEEGVIGKLRSSRGLLKGLERVDPGTVKGGLETVRDQVKYLRDAVDRFAEESARMGRERREREREEEEMEDEGTGAESSEPSAAEGKDGAKGSRRSAAELKAELQDSQENIVKLKSLLSTKREQVR